MREEPEAEVKARFVVVEKLAAVETAFKEAKRRPEVPRETRLSEAGVREEFKRAVTERRSEVLFPREVLPRMARSPLEVTWPRREMVKTSEVGLDPRRR